MKKRNKNNKSFLLLASLALIVTAVIGTTMAYLVSDTPTVTNTFTPATVDSNIEEDFNGTTKENVKIQNKGDIKAYIRAKVVVTWQDKDGNVYAQKPLEGTDYNIQYDLENGWSKGSDGFFYWALPVNPHVADVHPTNDDCYTGVLILSCSPVANKAPNGYNLHVEILAEAIQAEPANVVTDVWDFTPPTTNN